MIRAIWTAIAVTIVAGCASIPEDLGRAGADGLAAQRGLPAPPEAPGEELVASLLAEPLDAATAVRLALVESAHLRAAYARLGLSAAEIYAAGRISNPVLSGSRLDSDEPGTLDQVTFGLAQSFTDLLLLADRSELASLEFARAQAEVAAEIFATAMSVQEAWYELAAAVEIAEVAWASSDAAGAAAELAGRFLEAGNMSRLEVAELQAEAARAEVAALDARLAAGRARARLAELMGLAADRAWRMAKGLDRPAAHLPSVDRLAREAADSRLDLLRVRREVAALERVLDVTRRWRWLGELEFEAETERETDGARLTGIGLALELPVFDTHRDDLVRAESRLEAAYAERDALATRASHEIALAEARLEASLGRLTALGDVALPEQRRRVEETLARYNFMLTDVFDLLETRRAEYAAAAEYLEAVRDHWLAHVDLERAVGATIQVQSSGQRITAAALTAMDAASHEHHESPGAGQSDDGSHSHHHGGHRP